MIILIVWYPYGFQKVVEFKEILGNVKNVWFKSNQMLDELMNHMNLSQSWSSVFTVKGCILQGWVITFIVPNVIEYSTHNSDSEMHVFFSWIV